jgi:hypothetical protein
MRAPAAAGGAEKIVTTGQIQLLSSGDTTVVATADRLPRNLAVPCSCGAAVPLLLFVVDGRPHDVARCTSCGERMFLSRPPWVMTRRAG